MTLTAPRRRRDADDTDNASCTDTVNNRTDTVNNRTDDPDVPGRGPRSPGRRRRWLAGVLVVGAVAGLVWIVAFSSVLAARSVKVEGTRHLTAAQVVAAAGVPIGTPLVRVARGAIARRVEALPEVRSARVELSFPSTVVIAVTERVATAYRARPDGRFTYVDATGRTFDELPAAPAGLPLLAPAGSVAGDTATLAVMAQVAAALPASLRTGVRELTATGATAVELRLRDGRVVVWGGAERAPDKLAILPALLRRKGHLFDVSNPDLVFTR